MTAMLRNVAIVVFILVIGTSLEFDAAKPDSFGTVRLEYTAALTGEETKSCHIVVYLPEHDTFRDPKPERLVVYAYSEDQDAPILWQCYRDDTFLEYADLLQYDRVTKIEFVDVDDDGIDEAVISWDSDCMGSGWIQTLEVLDYDLETKEFKSYKGVTITIRDAISYCRYWYNHS